SDAGLGTRHSMLESRETIMSLRPLPAGGLLVASQDPFLSMLDADGTLRWRKKPLRIEPVGQERTLSVSVDGSVVDFGYEFGGKAPARFDVAHLALSLDPLKDGLTAVPDQVTLKIENWEGSSRPRLNGAPLPLAPYEISRSLAIHPDGKRF